MDLKVTLDDEVDAAYIYLQVPPYATPQRQESVYSKMGKYEVIFDIAKNGQLLGVEILGASEALSPEILRRAQIIANHASE
jgi:uncharacterized protein YuzE